MSCVDMDTFYHFVGNDKDEAGRMAGLFVEQSRVYFAELQDSMLFESEKEWHDVAHKFKGMAGFAGAKNLRDKCYVAQQAWQEPISAKEAMLKSIEAEMKQAIDFFENL